MGFEGGDLVAQLLNLELVLLVGLLDLVSQVLNWPARLALVLLKIILLLLLLVLQHHLDVILGPVGPLLAHFLGD